VTDDRAPVLLDFESRSRCPFGAKATARTSRQYWAHPTTEALVVVWYDTRDGSVGGWYPGQPWPHAGRILGAHNAFGFDRFGAERYAFRAAGWVDTSNLARRAGLPGALDELGTRWLGVPKDKAASRFTTSLSSVRRPPRPKGTPAAAWSAWWAGLTPDEKHAFGVLPALDLDGFRRVVAYCASDVMIMVGAWPRLAPWRDVDAAVEAVDVAVNDRGIAFDAELAALLLEADARVAEDALAKAGAALGLPPAEVATVARSPAQFTAATGLPDAQAATLADARPDAPPHVAALIDARQALASIARGKLEAGLRLTNEDGRLRDSHRYYGAHTGRWSGRGMQLQNLPRPAKALEDADPDELAARALDGRLDLDADTIAFLVRATLTAPPGRSLVACDFSAVEARAVAFVANDEAALGVFASGADPYLAAASAIYGRTITAKGHERTVGKIAELACGYGGGPVAFEKFARLMRVDLGGLDVRGVVDAWRRLHAPIVGLWRACESAFRKAVSGRSAWAACFHYVPSASGDAVACFLPSGRPIVYPGARATTDATGRVSLAYHGARGTTHVYGGLLVENAIQAYCRDLLADALVRVEALGLRPVLHVHDEIVLEVAADEASDALDTLTEEMRRLPSWAVGFPVDAAGWHGQRYRK